jgi:hypothetical protein
MLKEGRGAGGGEEERRKCKSKKTREENTYTSEVLPFKPACFNGGI